MRSMSRIVAFVVTGILLSLPVLGADDKDKKADPKTDDAAKKADLKKADAKKEKDKDDAKKTDVKKPDAKKDKDAEKDKEKPTEKWLKVGAVVGKVKGVVEAKKSLRIELQITKDKTQDVEWTATDEVKVRMLNPPPQFDDKGRIKRYTRKELKELKGNDKLRGYPAEFSDLKTDQYVEVTLVKKKGGPRPGVKRGKDADPDVTGEYLPKMSMIIIVAEPKR